MIRQQKDILDSTANGFLQLYIAEFKILLHKLESSATTTASIKGITKIALNSSESMGHFRLGIQTADVAVGSTDLSGAARWSSDYSLPAAGVCYWVGIQLEN